MGSLVGLEFLCCVGNYVVLQYEIIDYQSHPLRIANISFVAVGKRCILKEVIIIFKQYLFSDSPHNDMAIPLAINISGNSWQLIPPYYFLYQKRSPLDTFLLGLIVWNLTKTNRRIRLHSNAGYDM